MIATANAITNTIKLAELSSEEVTEHFLPKVLQFLNQKESEVVSAWLQTLLATLGYLSKEIIMNKVRQEMEVVWILVIVTHHLLQSLRSPF
jgi:hypothetical protein